MISKEERSERLKASTLAKRVERRNIIVKRIDEAEKKNAKPTPIHSKAEIVKRIDLSEKKKSDKKVSAFRKMQEIFKQPIKVTTDNITFDFVDLHNPFAVRRHLKEWDKSLLSAEDVEKFDPERLINRIREKDDDLFAELPTNCEKSCVGICYSGGYDSTLLVANAAEAGETIVPIIAGVNRHNPCIWIMAELVLLQLRRKYPHRICKPVMPTRIDFAFTDPSFYGYRMQPSIAFTLAYVDANVKKCLREIQVGFICKDECNSFLDEFINLYEATNKFIYPYDAPAIQLKFPLRKFVKGEIVNQLDNKKILNFAMCTCENPEGVIVGNEHGVIVYFTPCKGCNSCNALKHTPMFDNRYERALLATFGDDDFPIMDDVSAVIKNIYGELGKKLEERRENPVDEVEVCEDVE